VCGWAIVTIRFHIIYSIKVSSYNLAQVTETGCRNDAGSVVGLTIPILLLLVLLRREATVRSGVTANLGGAQLRAFL